MQVKPLKFVAWLGAAVLLAGIGLFMLAHWFGDAADIATAPKLEQAPTRNAGAGNEGAAVAQDGLAPPSSAKLAPQVRAESQPASDPRVWRSERNLFLSDKGFAASIHRALSDPSAARSFYALRVFERCGLLQNLGVIYGSSAVGLGGPEFATVVATCEEAQVQHGNELQVFAKVRAARLSPSDQLILDAVDGKRSAKGRTIAERFAIVAPTDDPLLLAEVGMSWLRSGRASYAGTPVSEDASTIFSQAWYLAACEATSSCETSVGAFRTCFTQQLCDGPFRIRLQSLFSKEDYEALIAYTNVVAGVLRSKDFSAFN